MKLSRIIQNLSFFEKRNFSDVEISGISSNSTELKKGELFVAIIGVKVDGHQFIEEAIERGAAALVVERQVSVPKHIPVFRVGNSRESLSRLAAEWYDYPSRQLPVIGVTGTNGKTTTTHLIEAILKKQGKTPGLIGTIGYRYGGKYFPSQHTTPESVEIQRMVSEMLQQKVDSLIMEVSSHAIDMHRIDDISFDLALFTNLTPEHLDYHKSMELYFEAKKKLFTHLLPAGKGLKIPIVNADDSYGLRLIEHLDKSRLKTYSTKAQSKWDFYIRDWQSDLQGMKGTIATPEGAFDFSSRMIGRFNLSNIIAAVAACVLLQVPLHIIAEAIAEFPGVPGRLERIPNSQDIHVFVDYAHTPDALKNVLQSLKDLDAQNIITVFGCGGDRDKAKRPIMGREVALLSDFAIITSDNPRTEDPEKIVKEILPGIEEGGLSLGKNCWMELDREKAIALAIEKAKSGDVILVAGKGHEDYQILGNKKVHFDDREVLRKFLNV